MLLTIGLWIFRQVSFQEPLQKLPPQKKHPLLVNKKNRLSKDYIPQALMVPKVPCAKAGVSMVPEAANALKKLFDGALAQGYALQAISGYRSYGAQKIIYSESIKRNGKSHTDKYVAIPGASEHQTGLAMDVGIIDQSALTTSFGNTAAGKWLAVHAKDYGFIIRYLKNKQHITGYAYEPWHIRYVGKDIAKKITDAKITLEEYLEQN